LIDQLTHAPPLPQAAAPPLVLASASPRRRELLAWLGVSYTAQANDAEERDDPVPAAVRAALPPFDLSLLDHPSLRAWRKASHAAALTPDSLVLGADTIVVLDGQVLNKPSDAAHARAMLGQLSGRTHTVYTGLCLLTPSAPAAFELVASQVDIAPLTSEQIAAYVATGEPLDKAGAYGIQGLGGQLVRAVAGSYTAVVGLPLVSVHRLLCTAGLDGLRDPEMAYHAWLASQGKEPLQCPPAFP
jgi:septum formation protein